MEAKGVGVLSLQAYVKHSHGARYQEWLQALPPKSSDIMGGRVLPSSWYSMSDAMVTPIETMVNLFHNGKTEGARHVGRYGAEYALSGFYRLLVKVGSAGMLISRAAHYMSLYYRPSEIKVVQNEKHHAVIRLLRWPEPSDALEISMSGWIERGLEISGCKDVNVTRQESLAWGDRHTDIELKWR